MGNCFAVSEVIDWTSDVIMWGIVPHASEKMITPGVGLVHDQVESHISRQSCAIRLLNVILVHNWIQHLYNVILVQKWI